MPYQGRTQLDRAFDLASAACGRRCSCRCAPVKPRDPLRAHHPLIVDSVAGEGPIVGIRSALAAHPDVAWLVLACDLPFLGDAALAHLLAMRDADALCHRVPQRP